MNALAWWVGLWAFSTLMAAVFAVLWIRALNEINRVEADRDDVVDRRRLGEPTDAEWADYATAEGVEWKP